MGRYIVRRLLYMLVVLLVVSMITFILMHAVPGGPFTKEKALPAETIKSSMRAITWTTRCGSNTRTTFTTRMIPHITTTPPTNSLLG